MNARKLLVTVLALFLFASLTASTTLAAGREVYVSPTDTFTLEGAGTCSANITAEVVRNGVRNVDAYIRVYCTQKPGSLWLWARGSRASGDMLIYCSGNQFVQTTSGSWGCASPFYHYQTPRGDQLLMWRVGSGGATLDSGHLVTYRFTLP